MTRTLIVLAGLLVCTTAHAQETHEKWLKYLAGEWTVKTTHGKPTTVTWTLAPGHHAILGTSHADDAGENAEIFGWEPDEKVLVHTSYGKKNGSHGRIKYAVESANVLRGQDTGRSPDGRTYAGTTIVRRVNQNTFTFVYSGNYTDGKQEKYEGKGEAVRIKQEGKVPAAKAFQEWGDYMVGVWTSTDAQGNKLEDRHEWVLSKSFLQTTSKVGNETSLAIGGIDPATGEWTMWGFDDQGRVTKGFNTVDKEGHLLGTFVGHGPKGPSSLRGRVIKLGPDKARWESLEGNVVDGKPIPAEIQIYSRKK